MWNEIQQKTKWIATFLSVCAIFILVGAKLNDIENQYGTLCTKDVSLQEQIDQSRDERREEYLKIQLQLTAIDLQAKTLEVEIGKIGVGQEWIIMEMKGEL